MQYVHWYAVLVRSEKLSGFHTSLFDLKSATYVIRLWKMTLRRTTSSRFGLRWLDLLRLHSPKTKRMLMVYHDDSCVCLFFLISVIDRMELVKMVSPDHRHLSPSHRCTHLVFVSPAPSDSRTSVTPAL
jgi:hypothetical protein